MDSIQQLVSKIQQLNWDNLHENSQEPQIAETELEQATVIEILDAVLAQKEGYPSGRAPPLDVIIYALNKILYPTFLPELMSDFLHLFTMLEFYRKRIIEKATLTVEMNTFYKDNGDSNVILLATEDEDFLRVLINEQKSGRTVFIKVVQQCCLFDLGRLWLANSNVDFWVRWNEYLSILNGPYNGTLSHSFHYDLSTDEIECFRRVGLQLANFMNSTVDNAQQLRQGKSIHEVLTDRKFQSIYAPSELSPKLREAIAYHQRYTQKMAQRFAAIAPKMSQSLS